MLQVVSARLLFVMRGNAAQTSWCTPEVRLHASYHSARASVGEFTFPDFFYTGYDRTKVSSGWPFCWHPLVTSSQVAGYTFGMPLAIVDE